MNAFISGLIGALIAVMIMLNGTLSNSFSSYSSSIIIHLVGLIALTIILIITKSRLKLQKHIPIYMYSAGAIGVFTVVFNNLSFSQLGVSVTLALGLLGQSVSSIIIDHYGLLNMKVIRFKAKKLIGLAFIIVGIAIMTIF